MNIVVSRKSCYIRLTFCLSLNISIFLFHTFIFFLTLFTYLWQCVYLTFSLYQWPCIYLSFSLYLHMIMYLSDFLFASMAMYLSEFLSVPTLVWQCIFLTFSSHLWPCICLSFSLYLPRYDNVSFWLSLCTYGHVYLIPLPVWPSSTLSILSILALYLSELTCLFPCLYTNACSTCSYVLGWPVCLFSNFCLVGFNVYFLVGLFLCSSISTFLSSTSTLFVNLFFIFLFISFIFVSFHVHAFFLYCLFVCFSSTSVFPSPARSPVSTTFARNVRCEIWWSTIYLYTRSAVTELSSHNTAVLVVVVYLELVRLAFFLS